MPAMWFRAFRGCPRLEAAGETETLSGNDGFSPAFAQCEVDDRFRPNRPRGREQKTFYSLGSRESCGCAAAMLEAFRESDRTSSSADFARVMKWASLEAGHQGILERSHVLGSSAKYGISHQEESYDEIYSAQH
jgi:hypothetical protein